MVTPVGVNVVVVFAISIAPVNATLFALCHLVTEPTLPDSVNAETVPPKQIVWLLATVPPTLAGVTVIINAVVVASAQEPFLTTAR